MLITFTFVKAPLMLSVCIYNINIMQVLQQHML